MSASHNSTDFHKGLLAAGVLLGNASISGFPLAAAVSACLLSDEDVEQMVTSSNYGFQSGREDGQKHPRQADSVQYDFVPTYSNISEPGDHTPAILLDLCLPAGCLR